MTNAAKSSLTTMACVNSVASPVDEPIALRMPSIPNMTPRRRAPAGVQHGVGRQLAGDQCCGVDQGRPGRPCQLLGHEGAHVRDDPPAVVDHVEDGKRHFVTSTLLGAFDGSL